MMTMQEAMEARHTVRSYTERSLPADTVRLLQERIAAHNERYGLAMKLVTENTTAFPAALKLVLAKGVRNYIVLAGAADAGEKLGYSSADLMLYAQTLGLNTWWVGGTFSKKKVRKAAAVEDGAKIVGIVAVGYGVTQGVPHKSRAPQEISTYSGAAPAWFQDGVRAVLLAPTALNKQAFSIQGRGREVSMTCDNGTFSAVDLGIGKYHFELGAGKDNFTWV